VGERLPEPLPQPAEWNNIRPGGTTADPADRVTIDESVTMAFLIVPDPMTPAERVALILHDVFRLLLRRRGRHAASWPPRPAAASAPRRPPQPAAAGQARVIKDFKQAWEAKGINALLTLLDPDATAAGDGGGLTRAELLPVEGAEQIARFFAGRARPGLTILERTVNGQPGLVAQLDGATMAVYAFDVAGGRIKHIWAILNPGKLRRWTTS
jgi:RNA polymerase sigma-70 factor (ECF subfamily)